MLVPLSAQQTLARALAIMQAGRGAALPELLKIIETLSMNICEVTVSELGELIEKDAVVLAKIISVANIVSHNPGISPLTTLSQAIHQIGYNRIRTIAVSLMLLETASASNPPEQREAAALALCAGLLAQGTAEQLGTHDPEFVFACAALRNFGPIMFAAVSIEHTRAAEKRIPVAGAAAAYRAQFGLTPLEFTRRLLSSARLPDEVLNTLRECEPESLSGVSTTYDARLLGLADYGSRLAAITLEPRHGSDAFVAQTRALGRRFHRLVPNAVDLARPALQRTDDRLRQFTSSNGVRSLPTGSLSRIDWRLRQLSPAEIPPDRGEPSHEAINLAAVTPDPLPDFSAPPPDAPELVPDSSPAFSSTSADPFGTHPAEPLARDPVLAALDLIRREFAAQECWLFRASPGENQLALSRTLGHAAAQPSDKIRLDPAERSVFGVALQRRDVVLIHDASKSPHLPRWYRHSLGAPAAFCLVPLHVADAPPALLLIGWTSPRRIILTAKQLAFPRELLGASAAARLALN